MPNTVIAVDVNEIDRLNKKFKALLQDDFNLLYVEKRIERSDALGEGVSEKSSLELFRIQKNKVCIFSKIQSMDGLNHAKGDLEKDYDKFMTKLVDYIDKVENKLDKKTLESFNIIYKFLKNREKKFKSFIKKFKIEDNWNIVTMRDEFRTASHKHLDNIITNTIRPISIGLKGSSAYEEVLTIFNTFLSDLGIYTELIHVGQKMVSDSDWELIDPQEGDDCDTKDLSMKNTIKEILSYPYLCDGHYIISTGKIVFWRQVDE